MKKNKIDKTDKNNKDDIDVIEKINKSLDNKNLSEKYPLSKNGRQCISICHNANTSIIHPLSMAKVTAPVSYCAIMPILDKFGRQQQIDECNVDDNKTESNIDSSNTEHKWTNILFNIINPTIDFNHADFLIKYYGIETLEYALSWHLEHYEYPKNNVKRIVNCAWKAFGINILHDPDSYGLTDTIVDYYSNFIKYEWIPDFIYRLDKDYKIIIKNDNISIVKYENYNNNIDHNYDEIKKHLIETMSFSFIKNNLHEFLKKYTEDRNKWFSIKSHSTKIKNYMFYKLEKLLQE
jgi:hypothetical protein